MVTIKNMDLLNKIKSFKQRKTNKSNATDASALAQNDGQFKKNGSNFVNLEILDEQIAQNDVVSLPQDAVSAVELKNITSKEMIYLENNCFMHILHGISFNVNEGEIFGLGSKTVNEQVIISEIVANIRAYSAGECYVFGEELSSKKRIQKENVYFIDTATMLFENMNVLEYLMLLTANKATNEAERQLKILQKLESFGLDYIALTIINSLSAEEKILVELFASLFTNTKLFIVNLAKYCFDGREISVLYNIAKYIKSKHFTLFITTMQPKIIGIICDKVAYISGGKVSYFGDVSQLIKQKDNIQFLINDSDLQGIYNQLLTKIPDYTYNLVGDTLFVLDDKERADNLFLAKLAQNNIVPAKIKVNLGRVENSFERLDNESDL
ncbi:MAG: hypothetical protein RR123_04265 [Clostridia bacterium]